MIIAITDAAWFAGFLDGEGSFGIAACRRRAVTSYEPVVSAANTNRQLLERCAEIAGRGRVYSVRPRSDRWKATFKWEVRAAGTAPVLDAIAPYIVGKREQVALLIELRRSIDEPASKGRNYRVDRVPPDVVAWRAQLKLAVHALNTRGGALAPIEQLDALAYVRAVLNGPTQMEIAVA